MIKKYGDGITDHLFELHEIFQKMIQWASSWDEAIHPQKCSPNWSGFPHFEKAIERADETTGRMYPDDNFYIDDGTLRAEFNESHPSGLMGTENTPRP